MSKMNIYNKSFEEVEPTDEETAFLDAFENGDPKYAPDKTTPLSTNAQWGSVHNCTSPYKL